MNKQRRLTIPNEVMARQVGDETVILDLASGTYFGLDPVGARIWQLIGAGVDVDDICETLLAEFDTTRETLLHDVTKLVSELEAQGLVVVANPP